VSTAARYLDPQKLKIWLPEGSARLRVEIDGEQSILSAVVRQCFPQSGAGAFLSIQDGAGKEIGILKSIDQIDQHSRQLLQRELDRRYYTPKISEVNVLRQEAGMWYFEVETQRGHVSFYVRNWRDSSHEIQPGRLQIHSVDGQRFEIPDFGALNARSQSLLEQLG
jgi:hypothetical protein